MSLLTTNTASVGLGGSGGVNLAKQGNQYVEVGTTASTNSYIDFHSSTTASDYDSRIIATGGNAGAGNGTLNIIANTIQLNTNTFRYIPWTSFASLPGLSMSNVMNFPTGANCPVAPSTATLKYRYSVVGNTMYVNYCYYSASAGTNGNGVYQFLFHCQQEYH